MKDARINELLALNSRIENERRMWKNRAGSLRHLLDGVLVELSVGFDKAVEDSSETKDFARFVEPMFRETLKRIRLVAARADALEADAWCKAVDVAREFMKDAEKVAEGIGGDRPGEAPGRWASEWLHRFKAALGS